MLTIPIPRYSSVAVWFSHFQIPPLFSFFPATPPPPPPPGPRGSSAVQISVYTSGWGWRHRSALPHRLTSPQMPIYCTWQPLWSRRTSGVEYAYWKTGANLGPNKCSRAKPMKGSPSQTHILNPPPPPSLQSADLSSYYKDLGRTGFCKQKLERSIKRHAGANDVIVVGMSSPELLKSPLWKCDSVCVCVCVWTQWTFSFDKVCNMKTLKSGNFKGKNTEGEIWIIHRFYSMCVCINIFIYVWLQCKNMNDWKLRRFEIISQTDMVSSNNIGKQMVSWRNLIFCNLVFCNSRLTLFLTKRKGFIKLGQGQVRKMTL